MADIDTIRSYFPMLNRKSDQKDLIYFDSACMGLRPQPVIDRIVEYYSHLSACGGLGRTSHPLAQEVTDTVIATRKKIGNWINSNSQDEVIFTKNTTEGMNIVLSGYDFSRECNIVTSMIDHHSSMLPSLKNAKRHGIDFRIVKPDLNGSFSIEEFSNKIDKKTELVSLSIASNVSGEIAPIREIVDLAHENDALVVADAAQYAPHRKIDVKKMGIDFLSLSIHKLGGPTGMGILWGKYDLLENLSPLIVGGESVEDVFLKNDIVIPKYLPAPSKFEAGLSNYAGIYGTEAIIDFINTNESFIFQQEKILTNYIRRIFEERGDVHYVGNLERNDRLPLLSFYIDNIVAQDIALFMSTELPNHQIMLRAGVHCAGPLHYFLNLDPRKGEGSARISLSYYNSIEELKIFENALDKLHQLLR